MTCDRCGAVITEATARRHEDWHEWLSSKLAGRVVVFGREPS